MPFGLVTLGCLAAACSGSTAPYTADADRGSTHALITVERRDSLVAPSQAEAFASFVRSPPEVDSALVTRLTGLDLQLPDVGECLGGAAPRDGALALSPLRRIELLAAGDVALETPEGRVELAPRAFPAVTDVVGGVVYSTRSRVAALPAGVSYSLSAAGSASLGPFAVSADAPPVLEDVQLAGAQLDATSVLPAGDAELSWKPGSARDFVYVTVTGSDGAQSVTCTFRDDAGRGVVPQGLVPRSSTVTIALHRLRSVALGGALSGGIDAGELRFDFGLSVIVNGSAQ